MVKILLAILIVIEILIIPLMIHCVSGITIVIPGLGLLISGNLAVIALLFVEALLIFVSVMIYRGLQRETGKML